MLREALREVHQQENEDGVYQDYQDDQQHQVQVYARDSPRRRDDESLSQLKPGSLTSYRVSNDSFH